MKRKDDACMDKYMYGIPLNSVTWKVPNRRLPIAHSTELVRNIILAIAEDCASVKDVKEMMRLNEGVVRVIDAYIKAGYGDRKASILRSHCK